MLSPGDDLLLGAVLGEPFGEDLVGVVLLEHVEVALDAPLEINQHRRDLLRFLEWAERMQ